MNNVIANPEDNASGIYKINYVPVVDVVSIPDAIDGVISVPVLLIEGANWYDMDLTVDANNFSVDNSASASGSNHLVNVTGFIAGDSASLVVNLGKMAQYEEFLVIATDLNGKMRLIGSVEQPAKFEYKLAYSGRRGYTASFKAIAGDPPPFYITPFVSYPDDLLPNPNLLELDAYLTAFLADMNAAKVDRVGDVSITGILRYTDAFTISAPHDLVYAEWVEDYVAEQINSIDYSDYYLKTETYSTIEINDLFDAYDDLYIKLDGTSKVTADDIKIGNNLGFVNPASNARIVFGDELYIGGSNNLRFNATSRKYVFVGASGYYATHDYTSLSNDATILWQDGGGTVAYLSDIAGISDNYIKTAGTSTLTDNATIDANNKNLNISGANQIVLSLNYTSANIFLGQTSGSFSRITSSGGGSFGFNNTQATMYWAANAFGSGAVSQVQLSSNGIELTTQDTNSTFYSAYIRTDNLTANHTVQFPNKVAGSYTFAYTDVVALKQDLLDDGTGFVKSTAGVITYDNSTYLTGTGVANRIAYWSGSGTLTQSNNLTYASNILTTGAVNLAGSGGAGRLFIANQSPIPTAISGGVSIYSFNNELEWSRRNSANSADVYRRQAWPDANTTVTYPTPDAGGADVVAYRNSVNTFSVMQRFGAVGLTIFDGTSNIVGLSSSGTGMLTLGQSGITINTASSLRPTANEAHDLGSVNLRFRTGSFQGLNLANATTGISTINTQGGTGGVGVTGSMSFNTGSYTGVGTTGITGSILFETGTSTTALRGGIAMFSGGAIPNWQSMQRGVFRGTATSVPTGDPTAGIFEWSADDGSTTNIVPWFRTSGGNIIKLASQGGWGTPIGTLTRTTFDTATVTLPELAERLAALISDFKTQIGLLKT